MMPGSRLKRCPAALMLPLLSYSAPCGKLQEEGKSAYVCDKVPPIAFLDSFRALILKHWNSRAEWRNDGSFDSGLGLVPILSTRKMIFHSISNVRYFILVLIVSYFDYH